MESARNGKTMKQAAKRFIENPDLTKEGFEELIRCADDPETVNALTEEAVRIRRKYYGDKVYTRGLIEFTNYCKNNCYYCGIRRGNLRACRYRLTGEEILDCCAEGYRLGFRTFVLQGGEDRWFTDERMADIIRAIRKEYPDCAITLSIGERSYECYRLFREAGADRYLLRHETASRSHYEKLHPAEQSYRQRVECLWNLKEIGYQAGAGFMVGSPFQGMEELIADMRFLKAFQPHMVGIGPFIPHHDTPFAAYPPGSMTLTLTMVALTRLLLPRALLPATTALGTIHPQGREFGLKAGANVVMPNLSPANVRGQYSLYDNKVCTGQEAAEGLAALRESVAQAGYQIVVDRGDAL